MDRKRLPRLRVAVGSRCRLVAPSGTPPAIVERLNAEVDKILKQPEVLAKLAAEGSTPTGGSAAPSTRRRSAASTRAGAR